MNWLDQRDILSSAVIGFEFEFFSNLSRKDVADQISRLCNKRVIPINRYHSKLSVNAHQWKVEPDFSGGMKMHELITGPMSYDEARIHLFRILDWINKFGWTTEKCAFQFNLSFNHWKINLNNNVNQLDKLKFILSFDENKVLENFPERRESIYVQSIVKVFPNNRFQFVTNVDRVIPENYTIPIDKYYGVNFKKTVNNDYIEFRYLGGENYQTKSIAILDVINYCINHTCEVLQNPSYNATDIQNLNSQLNKLKNYSTSFSEYDVFRVSYPNIIVTADLRNFDQNIKTYWHKIREKIFDLIVFCNMDSGWINYDSDLSRFQIKDANLVNCYLLENFEIVNSTISGVIKKCDIYHSKITNSHILDCKIVIENTIENSKIATSPIYYNNTLENCYIDNKYYHIDGTIKKCIIRSGVILSTAIIQSTENISGMLYGSKDKDSNLSHNYQNGKDKDSGYDSYGNRNNDMFGDKDKDGDQGYQPKVNLRAIGDKDKDYDQGYQNNVNLNAIGDKDKDYEPGYAVGRNLDDKEVIRKVSKFKDMN